MELGSPVIELCHGVWEWSVESREHRVELTSHAVLGSGSWDCIDPIPLPPQFEAALMEMAPPGRILLTNSNHPRFSQELAARWGVSILSEKLLVRVPADSIWSKGGESAVEEFQWPGGGWQVWKLPGGAEGELVLFDRARSLVVFGDAVVNVRGLEILPDKYCQDAALLRRSLGQWIDIIPAFQRAVFAHGPPLLDRASEVIRRLLPSADLD